MTSWLSEKMSHRHGDFLFLVDRRWVVLAAHIVKSRFRPRLDCRRALAPASEMTPFFQVAVDRHPFFEELLHRRVKSTPEAVMLPSFRRDLHEHVCAGESMRKQPVEEGVQLTTRETLLLPLVHPSLRFPSFGPRVQHGIGGRSANAIRCGYPGFVFEHLERSTA